MDESDVNNGVDTGEAVMDPGTTDVAADEGTTMAEAVVAETADVGGISGETADPPVGWSDYLATAALMLAFVVTMVLSLLFARPFADAGFQAFKDPENVGNSAGYIVLLLAFTALILWIARRGKKWMIQAIILAAVGLTIMYMVAGVTGQGVPAARDWLIGAAIGGASVWALYKHPEWYVVDSVGVLVAAGAAAIFGISLGVLPVIVLLVGLAVYDAIAVYKTKHMLDLADSVIELRLPVLLVVPKRLPYSFLEEATKTKEASSENKGEREAYFMGLGDLVMPTILVVSAFVFGQEALAVIGAAVGTLLGFALLMGFVLRGNPQAGLPLLNGGAIVGYLAGLYAATGSIVFW